MTGTQQRPRFGPHTAERAAEVSQRNHLICRLRRQGESIEDLEALTGLSRHQLGRVLAAGPPDLTTPLSGREAHTLRREYSQDPAQLEWLGSLRGGTRRNRRVMVSGA